MSAPVKLTERDGAVGGNNLSSMTTPNDSLVSGPEERIKRLEEMMERMSLNMEKFMTREISSNMPVDIRNTVRPPVGRARASLGAVPKQSLGVPPSWKNPTPWDMPPLFQYQASELELPYELRIKESELFNIDSRPQTEHIVVPNLRLSNEQQISHGHVFQGGETHSLLNARNPTPGPGIQRSMFPENNATHHESLHSQNISGLGYVNRRKMIPVHQWKIHFDGDNDLNDFLSKVEMFAKFEQTPANDLLSTIGYLFSKRALAWYRIHYQQFTSWPQLKTALTAEFLPAHSNYKILHQIDHRTQGKAESFGEYLSAMQILFSYMPSPPTEEYQLYLIRKNMDPTYAVALSTQKITSIQQLTEICRRMDDAKDMVESRNRSLNPVESDKNYRRRNFQLQEMEKEEYEVEAMERRMVANVVKPSETQDPPYKVFCWNCEKPGHTHNYCPQPKLKLFCYRCGIDGVSVPRCKRCNPSLQGNAPPGSQAPH